MPNGIMDGFFQYSFGTGYLLWQKQRHFSQKIKVTTFSKKKKKNSTRAKWFPFAFN